MDLEIAEPAADAATGRRNLIGLAGLAGLAGAATALLTAQTAGASLRVPTDDDIVLLGAALSLELSAHDLYRAQVDARPTSDLATAAGIMADNHLAYAQAIAGATGLSIVTVGRNDEVFDANVDAFSGSEWQPAAHTLEQIAVATHTELLGRYESADALAITTSILVGEARHATVLADLLGVDDFDTLFGNDESALPIEESAV